MPISSTGISIRIRPDEDDSANVGTPLPGTRRLFVGSYAQSGFTLIEVTLTVALLTLVLALVLPHINLTPSVADSGRRLVGAIQSLHTAAAASNRTYRLHIDLDQHVYWSTVSTSDGDRLPGDPAVAFRSALTSPVRFEDVTTGRHGKAKAGKVYIEFFPGGRVDPAVIHLSNQSDRIMALVVEPLTGDIQISDHYYMDPPKASISEGYREFFKALPLPPVLPLQRVIQP